MMVYNTSLTKTGCSVSIVDKKNTSLYVKLPDFFIGNSILLQLVDVNNSIILSETEKYVTDIKIALKTNASGLFFLQIYYATRDDSFYHELYGNHDIPIYSGNSWCFVNSKVFEKNVSFVSSLIANHYADTSIVPVKVYNLAQRICSKTYSEIQKVYAIHNWVADNIYYDYDAIDFLPPNKWVTKSRYVLDSRHTICQGYCNLALDMLRSVGIPTCTLSCYALEDLEKEGWHLSKSMKANSNHVITACYVDNRWLLMDITWDSLNRYENGGFVKGDIRHKYFDVTLSFLSNTHRIVSVF